jgi:subtilisin-like proprotein convertase family protein
LTGTTFTPSVDLAANTTFFWRVTPTNACGAGVVSPTFSFTTANLICRSPALAIPDNVPAGVNDTLTVVDPSGATLTNLKLTIKTTHTWVGDLKYTLSRTVGNTIVIDRPGVPASANGCNSDNIDVTIDDTAATLVENQCNATPPALSGLVKPNNPLATPFNGQALAGNWVLNVSDNALQDVGTVTQWCLVPTTTSGTTYTLTYTAGANGSITGTTPQTVSAGANGTPVTAVPNANYHFVQWSDASTQNPRTDTNVAANISVTASFAINTFTVTPSVAGGGAIAPNTPQVVNGGTTTAFTLTPNAGNHIVNVTGTCGGTLVGNTFTTAAVTANCTVIANFALNPLVFTTQPANVTRGQALGTVVVTEQDGSGNTVIDNSSTVAFTITACGGPINLGNIAMVNGVATLSSSQVFYTVASGLQINASTGTLNGTSQTFNVVAGADYVFADNFEGCRL